MVCAVVGGVGVVVMRVVCVVAGGVGVAHPLEEPEPVVLLELLDSMLPFVSGEVFSQNTMYDRRAAKISWTGRRLGMIFSIISMARQ